MRARKQKQLDLPLPNTHGGRRKGAGRPKSSRFQSHIKRPRFTHREPLHITLRLKEGLPSLRKKDAFNALRIAVRKARKQGLAIVHFAILSNHIHLIIEAGTLQSLSRQMQSFCISFAKRLNTICHRVGSVFRERYHLHVLRKPREVFHALRYVLANEGKHRRERSKNGIDALAVRFDHFSSASRFENWKRLFKKGEIYFEAYHCDQDDLKCWLEEALAPARSWLLTRGWMKSFV